MTEVAAAVAVMLICSAVMGRILFWIDNTRMTDRITRRLMNYLSWDYEEIKASAVGVWYYLTPAAFIAVFCIVFDHNIFAYLRIDLQDLGYIPVTILAEMSVVTMVSGSLTLVSDRVDWTANIGNISWISSIQKRNKAVAPLVPLLGALVEECFFRGTLFLILYLHFEQLGFWGAALISGALFALEQALFTSRGSQCYSMILGSLGISFVACASVAYTGSFLPCLLAHECFLVFYFGKFKYY